MNIEEKREQLRLFCNEKLCHECPLHIPELKCGRGQGFCEHGGMSDHDIDLAYSIAFPDAEEKSGLQEAMEKIQECCIKDRGTRREFETGAVRDIQEGKGRCDLLPLDVISDIYHEKTPHESRCFVLGNIQCFMDTGDIAFLMNAIEQFMLLDVPFGDCNWSTLYLEVSKHFEEGCKKYGENNWRKGIPTHCYIDSAIRHYLKWARGDKDEPHDRAFCWNLLCCIWTCMHKPELNDYRKDVLAKDPGDSGVLRKTETKPSNENRCAICLEIIPEGRQLCPKCEAKGWKNI